MLRFLKINQIEKEKPLKDKSGNYIQVYFEPLTMLPNGTQVFSNQTPKSRCLFGPSKDSKGDALYSSITKGEVKVGSLVEGSIQKFDTTEYQPEGFENPVTSFTTVVFSNENPTTVANRQLKQNYACIVENGVLTAEEQLKKPMKVSE